ncbi:hypothetical protein [Mesobacillus foraminis]|uniref:hypothetical protein n=1 Tax=Mesobacillus foraminis TaxID=279826 RepID=UPI0013CE442D|nr:hypothetical protein [Mesobacillus foraminis]
MDETSGVLTIFKLVSFHTDNGILDWNGRREYSCGISGTGEIPQEQLRGSLSTAPRKAKRLERKSTLQPDKIKKAVTTSIFIELIDLFF